MDKKVPKILDFIDKWGPKSQALLAPVRSRPARSTVVWWHPEDRSLALDPLGANKRPNMRTYLSQMILVSKPNIKS